MCEDDGYLCATSIELARLHPEATFVRLAGHVPPGTLSQTLAGTKSLDLQPDPKKFGLDKTQLAMYLQGSTRRLYNETDLQV